MLETWTLVSTCKYESTCSFVKYKFYYQDVINFAVFSTFLQKMSFFGKSSTYTQSNSMTTVLQICLVLP